MYSKITWKYLQDMCYMKKQFIKQYIVYDPIYPKKKCKPHTERKQSHTYICEYICL